jgi:hypothetical protein
MLTQLNTVRHLLFLQHIAQRQRESTHTDGAVGKQSRDIETVGEVDWGYCAAVLDMASGILGGDGSGGRGK